MGKMRLRTFLWMAFSATIITAAAVAQPAEPKKSEPAKPAGEPKEQTNQQMPDMAKMMEGMKKWLSTIKPAQQHKDLERFVGTWDTTTKMMAGGPGAPPVETTGLSTMKMVLDGRFLMEEVKGEMVMPDMETGQMKKIPFSGIGLTGYDNYKNIYVATWVDNLSTQMVTMTGTRDPAGKLYTYYGTMDEPMLDVHERMIKYVLRITDDDHHAFEIYDLAAGENYKVFETAYTRKK